MNVISLPRSCDRHAIPTGFGFLSLWGSTDIPPLTGLDYRPPEASQPFYASADIVFSHGIGTYEVFKRRVLYSRLHQCVPISQQNTIYLRYAMILPHAQVMPRDELAPLGAVCW
jgi:hypothetical protein